MSAKEGERLSETEGVRASAPSTPSSSAAATALSLCRPSSADGDDTLASSISEPPSQTPSPRKGFSIPKLTAKSLPIPMPHDADGKMSDSDKEEVARETIATSNETKQSAPKVAVRKSKRKSVPTDPVLAATQSNFAGGRPTRPQNVVSRRQLPTAAARKPKVDESMSMQDHTLLGMLGEDELGAKRAKLGDDLAEMDPSDYLNNAVRLEYPWNSLKLGEKAGSAALNRYLKNQFLAPDKAPQLSAQQTLQMVMSLNPRTILPPSGSVLHSVVQKKPGVGISLVNTSALEDEQESDDAAAYIQSTFRDLSRVYQFMCEQDVDDGEMNRREADYVREGALLDQLRSLENDMCDAKRREDAITGKAKEMGLVDHKLVVDIMLGQTMELPPRKPKKRQTHAKQK